MPFSRGRLTRITRSGSEVAYVYDRFGRITQDGELTYLYDANGNRAEIGYPGGVTARYTHDFADREASLEIQLGSAAPQTLVSGAAYKPLGPLVGLTLGNSLVETREFDGRYFPVRIEMPGRLLQTYTTDPVGNILGLARTIGTQSYSMTFSDFEQTEPVYNSEGLLLARRYHQQSTRSGRGDGGAPPTTRTVMETAYLFYFAGRPVAQLTRPQARQHPFDRPRKPKKSPAPLFHAASQAVRRELYAMYRWFAATFHEASEKLRAGDRTVPFPAGSFPPALPFVAG